VNKSGSFGGEVSFGIKDVAKLCIDSNWKFFNVLVISVDLLLVCSILRGRHSW
jgi:hypothetical protein